MRDSGPGAVRHALHGLLVLWLLLGLCPAPEGIGCDERGDRTERLGLEEALRMALEENTLILEDRLAREEARRRLKVGIRPFLPGFSLDYAASDAVTRGEPDNRLRRWNLGLRQLIFSGGRELGAYRSACRHLLLRDLQGEELIRETELELVLSYARVLKDRRVLEILRRSEEVLEEQLGIAGLERELGMLKEHDLLELRIRRREYALQIRDGEAALRESRRVLAGLISLPLRELPLLEGEINGGYRGELSAGDGSGGSGDGPGEDVDRMIRSLQARAETGNRDLLALELEEEDARRSLREARFAWIPRIEGSASYALSGSEYPLDEPSFTLGLDFIFQAPLLPTELKLQAGRRSVEERNRSLSAGTKFPENLEGLSEPASARDRLSLVRLKTRAMRRETADRVETLVRSILLEGERLELLREGIELESERLRIEEERMKLGERTRLDVVESEIRLAETRTELLEAALSLFAAEKELERLCGRGGRPGGGGLILYPEGEE